MRSERDVDNVPEVYASLVNLPAALSCARAELRARVHLRVT